MTDRDTSVKQRQLEWAREQLGVASPASLEQIRQAFFQRLADDDFVPNDSVVEAFALLQQGTPPPETSVWHQLERQRAEERVEGFSRHFFTMSSEKRHYEWLELYDECGTSSRAMAILGRLERYRGLNVESSLFDEATGGLVANLCELVMLPPSQRADRRAEIIEQCSRDSKLWERAAQRIQLKHGELVPLDRPLVKRLAEWSATQKVKQRPPVVSKPQIKVTRQSSDSGTFPWLPIGLIGILILIYIRPVVDNSYNSSRYDSPYSSQSHEIPNDVEIQRALELLSALNEELLSESLSSTPPPIGTMRVPSSGFQSVDPMEHFKRLEQQAKEQQGLSIFGRNVPAIPSPPSPPKASGSFRRPASSGFPSQPRPSLSTGGRFQ